MAVNKANINPQVLQWARKRLFPSVEAASGPLNVPAKRLEKWERGEDSPTFNQARKMAGRLRTPFGYFYLSSPPPEHPLPMPDFRSSVCAPPGIDLMEVIHDAQRKQAWYREEMLYNSRPPLSFIGRFSVKSPLQDIADDIRGTIGIDIELRQNANSWQSFLTELVRQTEDAGILVLRSGVAMGNTHRKLDTTEFRGFAIIDDYAPVIFINAQDSVTAQTFTLAHELAHVWIGESGVSSPDFHLSLPGYENPVEQVCHSVAEKLLEPEVAFLRDMPAYSWPSENSYWKQYGSKAAKHINTASYMNYLTPVLTRNSRRFTEAIIVALAEERIRHTDVAGLLNVKGRTLDSITRCLLGFSLKDA